MEEEYERKEKQETDEIRGNVLQKIKKEHRPIRIKDIKDH